MRKEMNAVDELLVGMIQRWPTLRNTRNDALYDLAEKTSEYGDEIEWDADGNIVFSLKSGEFHSGIGQTLEEKEAEIRAKRASSAYSPGSIQHTVAGQMMASEILFQRREAAKKAFIRDNADLIVASRDHNWGTTIPGSNAFRFLQTIPEHANPEWIEAFVGLAQDIMLFKYPASKFEGMADSYAARYQSDLEVAKENARAFLTRAKGTDKEKRDLAKSKLEEEIAKLRDRAAKEGLTLEASVS
jgi:hypothetical protein